MCLNGGVPESTLNDYIMSPSFYKENGKKKKKINRKQGLPPSLHRAPYHVV